MPFKDPEKKKEYMRKWYLKNTEKKKEYRETEKGIKCNRIGNWKSSGIIHDDFDALYIHYINTNECDVCKCNFTDDNIKCLDHDHDTGLFRYILCKSCNIKDNWKNRLNL